MMNWTEQQYEIDQNGYLKKTVSGVVCMGLGIHHEQGDAWSITHIPSGLRIIPVLVDTCREAERFGKMLLDLGNWSFEKRSDLPQKEVKHLSCGARAIMHLMRQEFDAR